MKINSLHFEVLQHLTSNSPDTIVQRAQDEDLDQKAAIGIAKYILGKEGDLALLSYKQKYYYDKCLKPLISEVPCDGLFSHGTCSGNEIIDDESLLLSYFDEDFLCQLCRYDQDKHLD